MKYGTWLRPGVRPVDRALILVLLDTGLRATELCNLLLEEVDFETGRMHISHGKGNKQRVV